MRDRDLCFHSGGTRGFTAFIGFCPDPVTAVVALTNTRPTPTGRFVLNAYLLLRSQALAQAYRPGGLLGAARWPPR
ncbi:hypothetical protein [Streptomyces lavendulocolor]|uniref:hypothetical protein n=1 Tax=Streptomyces lavendulocolor TaxID=67316 RepID=UPI0031D4F37E